MDERLIELVKINPILYDPAHKKYTDSTLKTDVWNAIAKQLKLKDANVCKLKWNGLRDTYRKHLRRNRTRIALGKKPVPYKYSDNFTFLATYYEKCGKNIKGSEENVLKEIQIKRELESSDKVCEMDGMRAIKVEEAKYVGAIKTEVEPQEEPDSPVSEMAGGEPVSSSWAEVHPVDAFLAGLAPMLKALAPHHLSLAKLEIFSVAHRYEMRSLLGTPPHVSPCDSPLLPPPPLPRSPPALFSHFSSEYEQIPFARSLPP